MVKKIFNFIKRLITFVIVLVIILFSVYLGIKYFANDEIIKIQIEEIENKFKQYILGQEDKTFIELKDENFKNELEKSKNHHYIQLDENSKIIYMVLENNIENFKSGVQKINLPKKLNDIARKENGQTILHQAFQDAWDAFSKDRPELFYLDGNKFFLETTTTKTITGTTYDVSIGKGENKNYYAEGFQTTEQIEIAIQEFNKITDQIVKSIPIEKNEYTYSYEKILAAHDWIVDNVVYDTAMTNVNKNNAYGAVIQKNAICEGYAEAFKILMDKMEVPCIIVCGNGQDSTSQKEEKHAWNYVYIGGKWYGIDTTWDDPIINSSSANDVKNSKGIKYKYFLKGSKTMNKDHVATGEIVDNGKIFTYPELSIEDFK